VFPKEETDVGVMEDLDDLDDGSSDEDADEVPCPRSTTLQHVVGRRVHTNIPGRGPIRPTAGDTEHFNQVNWPWQPEPLNVLLRALTVLLRAATLLLLSR